MDLFCVKLFSFTTFLLYFVAYKNIIIAQMPLLLLHGEDGARQVMQLRLDRRRGNTVSFH